MRGKQSPVDKLDRALGICWVALLIPVSILALLGMATVALYFLLLVAFALTNAGLASWLSMQGELYLRLAEAAVPYPFIVTLFKLVLALSAATVLVEAIKKARPYYYRAKYWLGR